MTEPMTDERLEECEIEASYGGKARGGWGAIREKMADCVMEIHHLRAEVEQLKEELDRIEGENRLNCAAVSSMSKKLAAHEEAMQQARDLIEYMAANWPGCECDSEDLCSLHLLDGILRASLEKWK